MKYLPKIFVKLEQFDYSVIESNQNIALFDFVINHQNQTIQIGCSFAK